MRTCLIIMAVLAATGVLVLAEPPQCTYCKLTDEARAGGPACSPTAWSACAPAPVNPNCPAGQVQAGTKWPAAGATVATCQPSSEKKKCTVVPATPWPETQCVTDGNFEITNAGCPQGQWKWRCQRTRQSTGAQVSVQSCSDSPDPECVPAPPGGGGGVGGD